MKTQLEFGKKIYTMGELRELTADLNDNDQICIETIDLKSGDTEDLYPMYIDVIEGVQLTDGSIVREVRFCQMSNIESQPKKKVNRKKFLNWYFSDKDEYTILGSSIVSELEDDRRVVVTAQSILDSCGYIPAFLVINSKAKDRDKEYEPNEIELVD